MKFHATPRWLHVSACAVFFCLQAACFGESTLTVSEVQQTSASQGSLELLLRTSDRPTALQMEVSYDSQSVEVSEPSGVQLPAADSSDFRVNAFIVSEGTMRVVLSSAKMLPLPDGATIRIPVKAKGARITNFLPLAISELDLVDEAANRVSRKIGSTVRVKGMKVNQVGSQKAAVQLDVDVLRDMSSDVKVREVEYFVNGLRVSTVSSGEGGLLTSMAQAWDLPGSGAFELKARMKMTDGSIVESRPQSIVITGVSTTPVKAIYAGAVVDVVQEERKASATGSIQLATTSIISAMPGGQRSFGGFSMKLMLNGVPMSATGRFREGSVADLVLKHPKDRSNIYIRLQQEATGLLDRITGVVTDGTIRVVDAGTVVASAGSVTLTDGVVAAGTATTGKFVANFAANRNVWGGSVNTDDQAGNYTVVLRSDSGSRVDGTGLLTVGRVGTVTGVFSLSDNSRVAQSGWLSKDGIWKVYAPLNRNVGFLQGDVDFMRAEHGAVSGRFDWRVNALRVTELSAEGGAYEAPARGAALFPVGLIGSGPNLWLTISGGSLGSGVKQGLRLDAANRLSVTLPNPQRLSIRLDSARGGFSGSFFVPGEKKATPFSGVWLRDEEFGAGFFSHPAGSGNLSLEVSR
jgi:hypothetical protein